MAALKFVNRYLSLRLLNLHSVTVSNAALLRFLRHFKVERVLKRGGGEQGDKSLPLVVQWRLWRRSKTGKERDEAVPRRQQWCPEPSPSGASSVPSQSTPVQVLPLHR